MLIADDEALIRHALRLFLESSESIEVVGEASNGADAVKLCNDVDIDVVLMDLQMPVMDGVEAMTRIVRDHPGTRVLALTTFSSRRHIVRALRAGAAGYIVKDTTPSQLLESLHQVSKGDFALSRQISQELAHSLREAEESAGVLSMSVTADLTPRELAIVKHLALGMSNLEIGRALHLSEPTVKTHLGKIMAKWGVRDRVQVLIRAVHEGLVDI